MLFDYISSVKLSEKRQVQKSIIAGSGNKAAPALTLKADLRLILQLPQARSLRQHLAAIMFTPLMLNLLQTV